MSTNSEKISVSTAVIIGMNAMIGAGIFSIASLLSSKVGPAGLITYLFAFFSVWCMAKSMARVAYLYPQEGSFYTYAKQWAGHKFALIAAGAYFIGLLIAMGLLCKYAGIYLQDFFPNFSTQTLSFITIICIVLANLMGLTLSQIGQYILIFLTLFSLITTTLMCLSKAQLHNLTPFMPFGLWSVFESTKVVIFGLFGFECTASLFNILENPEKNVSKALTYTLLIVGFIYLLFLTSIVLAIPLDVFAQNPEITIPEALRALFPNNDFILLCVAISILSAIIGTIHSMIWSSSQLLLSYFKYLQIDWIQTALKNNTLNQKTAVLICGSIIFAVNFCINNLQVFFSLADVFLIFAFITSMIPLLFLKQEWKSGNNVVTVLGLVTAFTVFMLALQSLIINIIDSIN